MTEPEEIFLVPLNLLVPLQPFVILEEHEKGPIKVLDVNELVAYTEKSLSHIYQDYKKLLEKLSGRFIIYNGHRRAYEAYRQGKETIVARRLSIAQMNSGDIYSTLRMVKATREIDGRKGIADLLIT